MNILKWIPFGLLSFWTWFKFFPPKTSKLKKPVSPVPPPKPMSGKATKRKARRRASQLLKLLMCAAAALPAMSGSTTDYHSKSDMPNPQKVISSTGTLSAYNLQSLRAKLTITDLFSCFNGLLTSKITPILLDCGASACTSPSLECFVKGTVTDLPKPILIEGIGGGVQIEKQGIVSYQTIDDMGGPLTLQAPAYYAPHIPVHLLSPQVLFMTSQKKGTLTLSGTTALNKNGESFLLMANSSRPVFKVKYKSIENFQGSLTTPVEESFGTAGVDFVSLPVMNVVQLEKLDDSQFLMLQRKTNGDLDLWTGSDRYL
jgi:hypothetical protein